MPNNKVKFGLKNVHVAPVTIEEDGSVTFGTPQAIPGAVNLSMDPQGDTETFYADNTAYYISSANDGYQGTLEMALIPDWFRKTYLGDQEDETAKVLIEKNDTATKPFALLYQFEGDQKASLRLFYHCTVARIAESSSTTSNTRTPTTETLTITASPLPDGSVKAKTTEDTPDSVRSGWFNAVWQPAAAPEG